MQSVDDIYHIYNRTVAKEEAFGHLANQRRFYSLLRYYRYKQNLRYSHYRLLSEDAKHEYLESISKSKPLVEVFAFVIMPNHYHILLRQLEANGTRSYLSNLQNSYAKYYNLKNDRNGSLFQNRFKARKILNNEDFLGISRYIHLNPVAANLIAIDDLLAYQWSSIHQYKSVSKDFIETSLILNHFKTFDKYHQFLLTPRR